MESASTDKKEKEKVFVLDNKTKTEIDRRYDDLKSGKDLGLTPDEFELYMDERFDALRGVLPPPLMP